MNSKQLKTFLKTQSQIDFDGENIRISPDLVPIFKFLQSIEQEVERVLYIDDELKKLKNGYYELTKIIQDLIDKILKYNPEYKFNAKVSRYTKEQLLGPHNFYEIIRSQMIILFSSIEVLYALDTAYAFETSNKDVIRRFS